MRSVHRPLSVAIRINAERLQNERIRRGWLLSDVATKAGLSTASVSRALRGGSVGIRVARQLAQTFGLSISSIIVVSESPEPLTTPAAAAV